MAIRQYIVKWYVEKYADKMQGGTSEKVAKEWVWGTRSATTEKEKEEIWKQIKRNGLSAVSRRDRIAMAAVERELQRVGLAKDGQEIHVKCYRHGGNQNFVKYIDVDTEDDGIVVANQWAKQADGNFAEVWNATKGKKVFTAKAKSSGSHPPLR